MIASSENSRRKKILYVDMDNTLVDFQSGIDRLCPQDHAAYAGHYDGAPGIFALMGPKPGAIEAFIELSELFDAYILSTAPWHNPSAWSDKLLWVQKHFGVDEGTPKWKRLILSHHKNLNRGDFIIDDRELRGVKEFVSDHKGVHIHFGTAVGLQDRPSGVAHMRTLA